MIQTIFGFNHVPPAASNESEAEAGLRLSNIAVLAAYHAALKSIREHPAKLDGSMSNDFRSKVTEILQHAPDPGIMFPML